MKSKEMYIGVGGVVLLIALVWWASSNGTPQEVVEDAPQNTVQSQPQPKPATTQSPKPSSGVTQVPTSVNPTVVQEKPVPTVPTAKSLAGSTFKLTTYKGTPMPAGSKFTLTFTEFQFSLNLCNTLSSGYYITGNVIKVNNLVSTQMYCGSPSNIMQIESDVSLMLNSGVTTIYRSGSTLILSHPQGITLSFEGS